MMRSPVSMGHTHQLSPAGGALRQQIESYRLQDVQPHVPVDQPGPLSQPYGHIPQVDQPGGFRPHVPVDQPGPIPPTSYGHGPQVDQPGPLSPGPRIAFGPGGSFSFNEQVPGTARPVGTGPMLAAFQQRLGA